MLDKLNQRAVDSLAQAMETVGFIVPAAAERPSPGPAHALLVSMPFSGPVSGVVEMVAAEELGTALAANTLTAETDGTPAAQRAEDALKELLNITCGALLCGAGADEGRPFDISLPRLAAFDSALEWQGFIATPGAHVLDADGALVAIRVKAA